MATKRKSKTKASSIDGYLGALSDDQRDALQRLRRAIRAAAPKAQECISYGVPAFRQDGRFLVAFGAAVNHCSFYPGSAATVAAQKGWLRGYDTSKGTIRFRPDKPLPLALVRKLVRVRLAQHAGRRAEARKP